MNQAPERRARVIVLGNEKGGTGKSTLSMHLIVALLRQGFSVGSLDLDANQGTLTRYLKNREDFASSRNLELPGPEHHNIKASNFDSVREMEADEQQRLETILSGMIARHDYVIIDSPGHDSFLSRLGHGRADHVVTPMNDSFLDLDLIADVQGDPPRIVGPSRYTKMIQQLQQDRIAGGGAEIDWIVLRNRLTTLDARNKRSMADSLDRLAPRLGFRAVSGFCERVIFRELFLQGLTVLDLREQGARVPLRMSHLAARQEVRSLMEALRIVPGAGVGAPQAAGQDRAGVATGDQEEAVRETGTGVS